MFSFTLSFLATVLLAVNQLCSVAAIPTNITRTVDTRDAAILTSRSVQAAPHWVIYSDKWAARPPAASALKGYNVL
jgi:hypothetical protein